MGRPKKQRTGREPLETIWRVSDLLWEHVSPIIVELDPPKKLGRKKVNARDVLDAIIFRMRTGCQWNQLPSEYPDDSSVHRTFQRWVAVGVFERMWSTLLVECEELGGVSWEWQAADGANGAMGKARFGGM